MKKLPVPPKKPRPADANMRVASILRDVVAASNKPFAPPKPGRSRKKK